MVVRGGMNDVSCEIIYVDMFDILQLLDGVSAGADNTYDAKTISIAARPPKPILPR